MDKNIPSEVGRSLPDIRRGHHPPPPPPPLPLGHQLTRVTLGVPRTHLHPPPSSTESHPPTGPPLSIPQIMADPPPLPPPAHFRMMPPPKVTHLGAFQKVVPMGGGRQPDAPLDLSFDGYVGIDSGPPPAHANPAKTQSVGETSNKSSVEAPLDLSVKKRTASQTKSLFRPEPVSKKRAVQSSIGDSYPYSASGGTTSSYSPRGGGPRQVYEPPPSWISNFGKPTPVGIATATTHSYEALSKPAWATPLPPGPQVRTNSSSPLGIIPQSGAIKPKSKPVPSSARRRSPILPVGKYAMSSTPEVVNVRGKAFKVSTVRPQVNGQPVITNKPVYTTPPLTLTNRPMMVACPVTKVNATIGSGSLACLQVNSMAISVNRNLEATTSLGGQPLARSLTNQSDTVTIEPGTSSTIITTTPIPSRVDPPPRPSPTPTDHPAPLLNIPKFKPSKKKIKKSTNVQVKAHIPVQEPVSQPQPSVSQIVTETHEGGDNNPESEAPPLSPACVSISTQTIEPQTFNYPPPDEPVDFNDLYPKPSRTVMCARKSTTKPSKRLLQQYLELRSPTKASVMNNHGKRTSNLTTMGNLTSPNLPSPCLAPAPYDDGITPDAGEIIKKETNPAYDPQQDTDLEVRAGSEKNREQCDGFTSTESKSVNRKYKSVGTDSMERISQKTLSTSASTSSQSAFSRSIVIPRSQWEKTTSPSSSPAHSSSKSSFSKISFEPLIINMEDSCDSISSSTCSSGAKSGMSKCSGIEGETGRLLARLLVAEHERSQSPSRASPHFRSGNKNSNPNSDVDVDHFSSGDESRVSNPSVSNTKVKSSPRDGNIFENIQAMASRGSSIQGDESEIKEELSLMCFEEMSQDSAPDNSPSHESSSGKTSNTSQTSFKPFKRRKATNSDAESKDIPTDTTKGKKSGTPYPGVANLSAFMSTIESNLSPLHYASIKGSIYAPVARTTSPVPIENTRFYQANILRGTLNRSASSPALESMNISQKIEGPTRSNSQNSAGPENANLEKWQREHIHYKKHQLRIPPQLIALPKSFRKNSTKRLSPEGLYDYAPSTQYGKAKACISTDSHTPVLTPIRSLSATSVKGLARLATLDASILHTTPKSVRTVADFNRARELSAANSNPDLSKEFEADPMETWTMVKDVSPRKPVSPAAASGKESSGTLVTVLRRERSRDDSSSNSGSSKSPVPFNRRKSTDAQFLLAKPSTSKQHMGSTEAPPPPPPPPPPLETVGAATTTTPSDPSSLKPKLTFTYNEGKPVIKITHTKKKSSKTSKPEKHRRFSYTIKGDPVEPPSDPLDPSSPPPKLSPIRLIASPPRKSKKSSRRSDTPPAAESRMPSAAESRMAAEGETAAEGRTATEGQTAAEGRTATEARTPPTAESRTPPSAGSRTPPMASIPMPEIIQISSPDIGKSKGETDTDTDCTLDYSLPENSPQLNFPHPSPTPLPPPPLATPTTTTAKTTTTSQPMETDSDEEIIVDSPVKKIPKLERVVSKTPTKRQRSPIKMTLKSKEVLSESDSCAEVTKAKVKPKLNQCDFSVPSTSEQPPKLVAERAVKSTSSPKKSLTSTKLGKKSKKLSKKHKKNKKRDGSKERIKDGEGRKTKKELSEKSGLEPHKVKKSSKKKKKSDKKESGEPKKKTVHDSRTSESPVKLKNKNSKVKSSKSENPIKMKSKKEKKRGEKKMEGETSEEKKRRYHKRMKARNLGKKIKAAEREREEEQKRGKKRRSLLDELANSDGYVADKRLEERKSKDLFADPSKLGREERALLRAMMQFSEMEQVIESEPRSEKDEDNSPAESLKRQDQSSALKKAQALRKSALKRARNKKGPSLKKKFDDFVPVILSTRTRRQTADKKNQKVESPTPAPTPTKPPKTTKPIDPDLTTADKPLEIDPSADHSGRWEILSDDDQKPSPQCQKSPLSPNSGLTLTIQWKPRMSERGEMLGKMPDTLPKMCRTPERRRRKSRSRRTVTGALYNTPGDDEHHGDLRNYSLDLDIPLANLRDQMCAPSPVPSVTSYTTVSTSCTDELPIPECVKKMSVNQNTGETILHKAARLGYEDVARFCAQTEYLDLDARDHAGYTAMHECCSQGHLEVTKLLIDGGASVNIPSCDGMRPLHDAVENDLTEMVRLLLSRGADPKVATYSGKTVLGLTTEKHMLSLLTGHFQDLNGCRQPQPEIPWSFFGSSVCDGDHDIGDEGPGMDVLADTPDDDPPQALDNMFEFSDEPMITTYFLPIDPVKGATNYVLLEDVTDHLETTPEAFLQEHFTVIVHPSCVNDIRASCQCVSTSDIARLKAVSGGTGGAKVRLIEYTEDIRVLLGVTSEALSRLKPEDASPRDGLPWRHVATTGMCRGGGGDGATNFGSEKCSDGLPVLDGSDSDMYDWNEQFLLGTRRQEKVGQDGVKLGQDGEKIGQDGEKLGHGDKVGPGREKLGQRREKIGLEGEKTESVMSGDGGGGGVATNAIYKGLFLHGGDDSGEGEEEEEDFYYTAMESGSGESSRLTRSQKDDDIHFKKPY